MLEYLLWNIEYRRFIVKTFTIVLLVILVILIVACVVLYFVGKKAEKKQADQQAQLDAVAQTVSILVIDKGRMKLKRSRLTGYRNRKYTKVSSSF